LPGQLVDFACQTISEDEPGRRSVAKLLDVLDLSKIEAGQLVLELSDYCIQDIAQTVRNTLEPLASDKKLERPSCPMC
jgi:signal transduction histidine kinase